MRAPRIPARPAELRSLMTRGTHSPYHAHPRCSFSSSAVTRTTGLHTLKAGSVALSGSTTGSLSSPSPAAFFLSNRIFDRSTCLESLLSASMSTTTASTASTPNTSTHTPGESIPSTADLAPHRRRQAARKQQQQQQQQDAPNPKDLPPDASSLLTTAAAAQPSNSLRRNLSAFLSLTKPRLTVLIVLTAMAPYALYPVPEMLTPTMTETPSLSPLTLFFLTTGTALCSGSANALNMLYESRTDAIMTRTRNRPLVRNLLSKRSAIIFALLTGATGVSALYFGVNPTVSGLGFANILLYAGVYTPLKTVTVFNTWVGAVVGGIPPLMGWAAAAGETATGDGSWRELLLAGDGSSIGGWLLAALLGAWQFPHFMALSWSIREDYKAAGIRMLAWTNPARNARVALRYSLVFTPICLALCAAGVTNWGFAVTSLPVNAWLAREAVRFWKKEGHGGTARSLFWASIWHLPAVLILALLHKEGMWTRAWNSVMGTNHNKTQEGDWEEEDEMEEMASMTADKVAEKKVLVKTR